MEIQIEKLCKKCNVSNLVAKFGPKRLVCVKCCSMKNNIKLKENNYYKEYYKANRDEFIEKGKRYYTEKVKCAK